MLTYFLPDFNNYKIRTKQLPANSAYMRVDVQNMLTLDDYSFLANPGQWSYNECESIVDISFNLDVALNVNVGDEYRIFLTPGITSSTQPFRYGEPVWHGSLQVFASQSVDKPEYVNQIPLEGRLSRDSENEFVYWNQQPPVPPTTTTTSTTTTTTLAPTTTTTTTAAPQVVRVYASAIGSVPSDVGLWYRTNTPFFLELGDVTPAIYPSYNLIRTLSIPPDENLRFGITDLATGSIQFGTGSVSGDFTSRCGLTNPTFIPAFSWTGSVDVYINIETAGGNYVSC